MAPPRRFYGTCKGHANIRACPTCGPIARAEWNKTHYNRRTPEDDERIRRNRKSRVKSLCVCGKAKQPGKWYCDADRKAFRQWSQTAYVNRRRKKGWRPKRDYKGAYQRRVKKYGREALARSALLRYHERRFKEREKQRGDS